VNKMEDIESKIYAWAKEYAQKEGLKINSDQGIMVQLTSSPRNNFKALLHDATPGAPDVMKTTFIVSMISSIVAPWFKALLIWDSQCKQFWIHSPHHIHDLRRESHFVFYAFDDFIWFHSFLRL